MNYLQDSFFKYVTAAGLILTLAASLVFMVFGQGYWSAAIFVSFFWMCVNCYFLFQIVRIGMNASQKKDRVLFLSIIKFPVLYLVGFFILKSRFFPSMGILLGLTLYFAALATVWIYFSLKEKNSKQEALS